MPDVIDALIVNSILRKAVERKVVKFHLISLRKFGQGNYQKIDDKPFGGGSGMVMMAEPLIDAIDHTIGIFGDENNVQIIYPSPQGKVWNQDTAFKASKEKKLIFICGHYKGIDERVIFKYDMCEYSIGDFVLTGGEIPTMLMIDSAVRLIPGTLNTLDSAMTDTFTHDLLDHPYYTQPREIRGMKVPDILLSGHHEKIKIWKQNQREKRTKEKRPDLWELYKKKLNESEKEYE